MNEKLWNECVRFHGHACPGLAFGYRAAEYAMEELGIPLERAVDEEIVCVAENDGCGVDCIQCLISCTVGKGNMLFRQTGKGAYSFFNRADGKSIRLVTRPFDREQWSREGLIDRILNDPAEEIFEKKVPDFALPEKARLFDSVVCDECGEAAREDKIRLDHGRKLCLDCHKEYGRSFL
jgi:formylmethanofuran dehydrogenase subunit E